MSGGDDQRAEGASRPPGDRGESQPATPRERSAPDDAALPARREARRQLETQVALARRRKLRSRRERDRSVWFGLGMFGLVGWSVAVPALLGVALGLWIDRRWPGKFSWTLMLMVAGVLIGCWNAWWWMQREGHGDDGSD